MKKDELPTTSEDVLNKVKQPGKTGMSTEKHVVIPDECGDSLWDAVLAQDTLKTLLVQAGDERKDQSSVDEKSNIKNSSLG